MMIMNKGKHTKENETYSLGESLELDPSASIYSELLESCSYLSFSTTEFRIKPIPIIAVTATITIAYTI